MKKKNNTVILEIVAHYKSVSALARKLECSRTCIHEWINNGVSLKGAKALEKLTRKKWTKQQIAPHIFD